MLTSKAAILVEQKKPLEISEITIPDELEPGQVLVRVKYSGICGSQLGEIDGVKGPDRFLPHLLGHEGGGIVIKVGPAVTTVEVGDNVVLHWMKSDGINSATPKYNCDGKVVNAGWVTTFNEYAIVSENRLTTINKMIPLKTAALYGCAVTTGFGVALNDADLKPGKSLVVFGAGGIGLSVIQAASLVSALPIIAVDLYDNRLELAKQLGADYIINAKKQNPEDEIKKICPDGVDVAVDNTGNPKVIQSAYELTSSSGQTVLVGVPGKGADTSLHTLPLHFGKEIRGSFGGSTKPEIDIDRYIKLNDSGKVRVEDLITDTYKLDDINEAIAGMRSGAISGRCIITMDEE